MELNAKENFMLAYLNNFYLTQCTEDEKVKIKNIIDNNLDISLRQIDNFVIKIAPTDIKNNYKTHLKLYGKKYFDAFRRGTVHIDFPLLNIKTTIGQLNFFKWVIQNNILHNMGTNLNNFANMIIPIPIKVYDDNICSICLDDLMSNNKKILECGHCFHSDCLYHLMAISINFNNKCPNCRSIINLEKKMIS